LCIPTKDFRKLGATFYFYFNGLVLVSWFQVQGPSRNLIPWIATLAGFLDIEDSGKDSEARIAQLCTETDPRDC